MSESRATVDLMLDRNTLVFYADVEGDRVEGKTAAEAKEKVRAALKAAAALEWTPIITVEVRENNSYGEHTKRYAGLTVGYERFLVARTKGGTRLRTNWETPEERRIAHAHDWHPPHGLTWPLSLPHVSRSLHGNGTGVTTLAYDEALWNTLVQVHEGIDRLRERLAALVAAPEHLGALAAQRSNLLALPPASGTEHAEC